MMDDNIDGFSRWNNNMFYRVKSSIFFRIMEDFSLKYENVAMSGPQYEFFITNYQAHKPISVNKRIFSCNLIRNDLPLRWRGRWNEDAILSFDILKAGYCTILFNSFLQDKISTQVMKGGNTDTVYKKGTFMKSKMLVREHPDLCHLIFKYNRWHHSCNSSYFEKFPVLKKNKNWIQPKYNLKLKNAKRR